MLLSFSKPELKMSQSQDLAAGQIDLQDLVSQHRSLNREDEVLTSPEVRQLAFAGRCQTCSRQASEVECAACRSSSSTLTRHYVVSGLSGCATLGIVAVFSLSPLTLLAAFLGGSSVGAAIHEFCSS